jgi:hypothetical protein
MTAVWARAAAENCHKAMRNAAGSSDFVIDGGFSIKWICCGSA